LFSIVLALSGLLLKNIFSAISIGLGYWLSGKLVADLRSEATDTLMEAGLGFYDKSKTAQLTEHVLGHTHRLGQLFEACIRFIVSSMNFLVLFILLFVISWKLTLISILLTGIIALLLSGYINSLSKLSTLVAKQSRKLSGDFFETITGLTFSP
jgi:ABC-type multidrug transport system fused ATPase/permease subunit